MKRLLASALTACALLITSCGTDVELGDRPQYRYGANNLTLFVFDGQSGGALDGVNITVTVGEDVLTAKQTGNAYVVTGIPNGSFPVNIEADGYLPITGVQAFTGGTDITLATTEQKYLTFTVAMYPVLSVPDDVTVKAYDGQSGTLIAGGEVTAKLEAATAIGAVAGAGTSPFAGSVGFVPNTINVTLTNGSATIPRAQLVYGATYTLSVTSARNAQGQYLAPATISTFKAGTTFPQVVVFMGAPAVDPVALSANNEGGGFQNNLTVTFPYPVALCNGTPAPNWVNAAATLIAPAPVNPVTATLGSGNTQLTLVYNIDGADNPALDLSVTFTNVKVRVSGGSTCAALDAISLRGTSAKVSPTIAVRDVP